QTPPITLVEVLQARLDSVGSSKQIAQIAATMGREFDLRVVDAAIEHLVGSSEMAPPDRSVDEHIDRLIGGGLVDTDPTDSSRIWFRHALVAEAAYESQFDDDRRARHLAIADVLADDGVG